MVIVSVSVGEWLSVTQFEGDIFSLLGAGRAVKERDSKILNKAGG